jgi:hypothetical protein
MLPPRIPFNPESPNEGLFSFPIIAFMFQPHQPIKSRMERYQPHEAVKLHGSPYGQLQRE